MSLSRDTIFTLGNKIAPTAATFSRLRSLLLDPTTDLEDITKLIRLDAALTFHVVRLSNSVLFGIRDRTDSLDIAVSRVGLSEVFRLVGLAALQQVCQRDLPTYRLSAQRLWENAIATAAAAELLAQRAGRDPGLAYTAGLMRTIGRVILDGAGYGLVYPGEAEWPSVTEWEKKTFGMTSAEATTLLLNHWRFPSELVDAVSGHFEPLGQDGANISACVLNLACGVAARFGLDLPGEEGDWLCTPAKLTLAGVNEADLEDCANRARALRIVVREHRIARRRCHLLNDTLVAGARIGAVRVAGLCPVGFPAIRAASARRHGPARQGLRRTTAKPDSFDSMLIRRA